MALPATDDFAGTGALSASWTAYGASGPPERNSGAASSATGSGGASGYAWWNADAFADDQKSTIVLGANYGQCAAGVRMTGTSVATTDGYQLWVVDSTTLELHRLDDGSFNSQGQRTVTTLVADDEITLEVSGTTLTAKVNGVQQGATFTEATYASGAAGFVASEEVSDHIRSWTGDDLAAAASAAITGTATASIDEADVVAGGKTIIITLTGDTWVASGATFDAQRQAIVDGLDSAQSEATGWNAEVRDNLAVTTVVRTSDTVVTITLSAQASYDITAQETITVTVPGSALTGASPLTGSPTFTVDVESSGTVGPLIGGRLTRSHLIRGRLIR